MLFGSVAINAALLIFFAGVFRKMMNTVDEATFKKLIVLMVRYSNVVEIKKERAKFNAANIFQAILCVISTVLVGLGLS